MIHFQNISVYDLTMRTISSVESSNSQMKRSFPKHGNIWKFSEQLKFFESMKSAEMKKLIESNNPKKTQKKSTIDKQEKIEFLTASLKQGQINIEQFLEAMSMKTIFPLNRATP